MAKLVVVGVVAVACSGAGSTAPTVTEGVLGVGLLPSAENPSSSDGAAVKVGPVDSVDIPVTGPQTVPATAPAVSGPVTGSGVPGIDDDEVLCSAWARYVGSTQTLSVAANFGQLPPFELARLEVLAAPVVRAAVDDLERTLPASLDAERAAFVDGVVGPLRRRAASAEAFLIDSGVDRAQLMAIAETWLAALRDRDPDEPVPSVAPLDPTVEALVDEAALRFEAAVTAFGADPSLDTTAVATPGTDTLLADRCPDLTSLGVGDDI